MDTTNKPVAWLRHENGHWRLDFPMVRFYTNVETPEIPLYTAPELARKLHTTKTLTDEEIVSIADDYEVAEYRVCDFARAILKKASEK
jgi:hypothetical protein